MMDVFSNLRQHVLENRATYQLWRDNSTISSKNSYVGLYIIFAHSIVNIK